MRYALLALALMVGGCGEPQAVATKADGERKIELVCIVAPVDGPAPQGASPDGYYYESWAEVALSVDGRVAVSDYGFDWQWADTHENVGDGLELALFSWLAHEYPRKPYEHKRDLAKIIAVPDCAKPLVKMAVVAP